MAICTCLCLISVFLISGCIDSEVRVNNLSIPKDIHPFCDDGVICYNIHQGYAGSGSCFRDSDLVKKYCKEEEY